MNILKSQPINGIALVIAAMALSLNLSHAVMVSDASGNAVASRPDTAASGNGSPYRAGERVAYASLALGGISGAYGSASTPPIIVGLDWGLDKNFSAGGFIGIARSTYDYGGFLSEEYSWTYTYIPIAGRAAYHVADIIKDVPLDPYVAVALGYNVVTVSGRNAGNASSSYFHWGADIGARYWFKPSLAAQLELGYGLGFLSLGLAYKI